MKKKSIFWILFVLVAAVTASSGLTACGSDASDDATFTLKGGGAE